jgi:hypothetical protein
MPVTIGQKGLLLQRASGEGDVARADTPQQRTLPLFGGCLQPFAIRPTAKERVLDALGELGVELLQIAVPWGLHEVEGQVVIDGSKPGRDLISFLESAKTRGLSLIADLGPVIDGELDRIGLPERLFSFRDALALGPSGEPALLPLPPRAINVPSLASERYMELAISWLTAIVAQLTPYAYPNGPIVAFRCDHSLSSFYRTDAYDLDYHPRAIEHYRQFIAARYPDGVPYARVISAAGPLKPPTGFLSKDGREPENEELLRHLDWVAFKEQLASKQLARLTTAIDVVGTALPVLTGQRRDADGLAGTTHVAIESAVAIGGLDMRLLADQPHSVRRSVSRLAATSRFGCVTRLDWGAPAFFAPPCLETQKHTFLRALMYGARGVLLDSLMAHDRWVGAPISRDGKVICQERFALTKMLLAFARDHELGCEGEVARVAMLELGDYRQLARISNLLSPFSPLVLSLLGWGPQHLASDRCCGFSQPLQRVALTMQQQIEDVLAQAQIPLALLSDDVPSETFKRYDALIVPLYDFIDASLLVRLSDFVAKGGALFCGPRLPHLLRDMQPLDERHFPPHTRFAEAEELESLLPAKEILSRSMHIDCKDDLPRPRLVIRASSDPQRRLLFIDNATSATRQVAISGELEGVRPALWDALSGVPIEADTVALAPQSVRVLAARRTP